MAYFVRIFFFQYDFLKISIIISHTIITILIRLINETRTNFIFQNFALNYVKVDNKVYMSNYISRYRCHYK